jgi:hypothetical protein
LADSDLVDGFGVDATFDRVNDDKYVALAHDDKWSDVVDHTVDVKVIVPDDWVGRFVYNVYVADNNYFVF